jgi:hypothetical protein
MNVAPLVIDEVGFEPMSRHERAPSAWSPRYCRGSILITTNKGVAEWPGVLASDEVLATALLDRLLHRSLSRLGARFAWRGASGLCGGHESLLPAPEVSGFGSGLVPAVRRWVRSSFVWSTSILFAVVCGGDAQAKSLSSSFDEILRFEGQLEQSPAFRRRLEVVLAGIQGNAVRSADIVATATAPGFVYRYQPDFGVAERVETSQGPVYVETPETVGAGNLDVGVAYQYNDFTKLDGDSLEAALNSLRSVRGPDTLDISTQDFDLTSHILSFSGTYGLTAAWDVNVLMPIFFTSLRLQGDSALLIPGAAPFLNHFDESQEKVGPGDLLLRTKYRVPDIHGFQLAPLFTLRLPTGHEDDFQGLGDVTMTPTVAVGRRFGRVDIHLNVGVEANASSVDRSRVRYALGTAVQVVDWLSVLVDAIGSSGFHDDSFESEGVTGSIPRTDIVDAVAGIKVLVRERLLVHLGAIVPLTIDGLRPDVVPTGGFEYRF